MFLKNLLHNKYPLRENIVGSGFKSCIDNERVLKCIKLASLEDLLKKFVPNGIFSYIVRGVVFIWRVSSKSCCSKSSLQETRYFNFDEATSSQDAENENFIKTINTKFKVI